ncbi:hypothetical protein [Nonomuraea typhae]|uniref:hypothetical protein n=1 Tax=Nonomuraea typhae TaxID=2603600 RepID=UPI0012FB6B5F|nr:hypothetical protein [Nonomuraea typhae]
MKFTQKLVLAGLAACALGGGTVAAYASASTPAPGSAPAASATRPAATSPAQKPAEKGVWLPIDYTSELVAKLGRDYDTCLKDQGVTFVPETGPAVMAEDGTTPGVPAAGQEDKLARCEHKKVRMPKEMDPRYNPGYDRDFREWVRLLNENGVPVKAVKDGWNYTAAPKMSESKLHEIERRTRIQAFS